MVTSAAAGAFDCHCFATRQLARHVTKLYERHLEPAGLSSNQFAILALLAERPAITLNELSELMVMDRTSLLRALKPLQRDRFVTSAPKSSGSRQLAFSLSRLGMRKVEQAVPLWSAAQREYEAQIGSARAARLRRDFFALTKP
jgi:DNA-binding MarR family transcriptional regulator